MGDSYVTFLVSWSHKNCIFAIRVQGAKTLWIVAGVDSIYQSEISKIVNVNSAFEDNYNSRKNKIYCFLTYLCAA